MPYSLALVSRVKGALHIGIPLKVLSRWTGIPFETLKHWKEEDTRAAIAPDPTVLDDIRLALLKEN